MATLVSLFSRQRLQTIKFFGSTFLCKNRVVSGARQRISRRIKSAWLNASSCYTVTDENWYGFHYMGLHGDWRKLAWMDLIGLLYSTQSILKLIQEADPQSRPVVSLSVTACLFSHMVSVCMSVPTFQNLENKTNSKWE